MRNFLTFVSVIIICFSFYFSKNIKLDASSDTLILDNDETFKYFEYYNKIFPSKNFLVLAIKSDKEIDDEYINNINIIKKKIDKLNNIESTFSIVDAPILLLNNSNLTNLSNGNIENINNTTNDLKLILNEFSSSPIYSDQIINTEKNLSSIIIYIKKNKSYENIKNEKRKLNQNIKKIDSQYRIFKEKNNQEKEKLIKDIRNIIKKQSNNYQYFLGGIDMIASDTLAFVKNDIIIFSIAVIFFIIIVLLFIYKDIKWVAIPLISTIYAVVVMTGFIGLMNWEITAISSNFISLMLILSISMNIHIINHYKINYFNKEIKEKLKNTIFKMFWPCFYTALTTIVAFGSLLFSNIKPIVDFGSIMIIALLFIFITSFTILPLIIFFFPNIDSSKRIRISVLNKFYQISIKQTKNIIIINILVFIISIIGISKLNVENSFINYFKSDTEIYKGMKLIDTELGGTTPIDILIKFKDIKKSSIENNNSEDFELIEDFELNEDLFLDDEKKNIWFSDDKLSTIKKIHTYLDSKEEVGKVLSLNSLIEMGNLINKNPLSIFELSIIYNELPKKYRDVLIKPFLSVEENMIKISARIKDSNNIKRNDLILDINKYLKSEFNNIQKFEVNGLLVLYNNMLQSLFNSQIKSFGIILISIFIMFIILFRSLKLSIIGIIPNIIASTFILGLIGILKISLDIMTITIAAITIGIAVDNTIHYIYRIKENRKNQINKEESILNTHNNVGNAVLTTSLTISFGFSVLCLSSFIPTILFGVFTALAMLIAMIGVLITLPAILNKFYL